jgi:Flp pilus assembly protein TadD
MEKLMRIIASLLLCLCAFPAVYAQDKEASYKLGVDLFEHARWAEAAAAFQKQTEITPNHENAWDYLGSVLDEQGKKAEAIAAYRKQLEVTPAPDNLYSRLAQNNLNLLLKRK